jgi:uncharacterized membrane protein HdeD (DUF308 family)
MDASLANVSMLFRNWWLLVLRGVVGIIFGIIAFVAPGISLAALVLVFGAYCFADGALLIVSAIRRHGNGSPWWLLLLQGMAGIAAGVVALFWPAITTLGLLWVIAAWSLVSGVLQIVTAIRLRKTITTEWLLALSGVASIALGVLFVMFPAAGAVALVFWIGAWAFVFGVLLVTLGFRLRSWRDAENVPSPPRIHGTPQIGGARIG